MASQAWTPSMFFVAMGMLFNTAIVSPGYLLRPEKQWGWIFIFGAMIVLAILAVLTVGRSIAA